MITFFKPNVLLHYFFIVGSMMLMATSCTIEKRLYTGGYHVQFHLINKVNSLPANVAVTSKHLDLPLILVETNNDTQHQSIKEDITPQQSIKVQHPIILNNTNANTSFTDKSTQRKPVVTTISSLTEDEPIEKGQQLSSHLALGAALGGLAILSFGIFSLLTEGVIVLFIAGFLLMLLGLALGIASIMKYRSVENKSSFSGYREAKASIIITSIGLGLPILAFIGFLIWWYFA